MTDSPIVRIGQTLTRLREAADLSQKDLAAAIGMSQSLISRLEHGTQEPQLAKLVVLAKFFGLSLGQLLDGDTAAAAKLPEVKIAKSVSCDRCGTLGAGLTTEKAQHIQAAHRLQHAEDGAGAA